MTQLSLYLPWILLLAIIFGLVGIFRWYRAKKDANSAGRFVNEILQAAREQKVAFDLKLINAVHHAGMTAFLTEISPSGLLLAPGAPVAQDWTGKEVEAYFRVGHEDSAVFYVFEAPVLAVRENGDAQLLEIGKPARLRVEKKRHFLRVRPNPKDILMLAVWPVKPGKRLPRSNADIGQPPMSWKSGHDRKTVSVDNISGAGIAINLDMAEQKNEDIFNTTPGRQLLCLMAYRPEPNASVPVIFWCAGEIKNVRKNDQQMTLGLEFTNTAVQEKGSSEIHWTHSSPWKGVKPILQWVQRIDKTQN